MRTWTLEISNEGTEVEAGVVVTPSACEGEQDHAILQVSGLKIPVQVEQPLDEKERMLHAAVYPVEPHGFVMGGLPVGDALGFRTQPQKNPVPMVLESIAAEEDSERALLVIRGEKLNRSGEHSHLFIEIQGELIELWDGDEVVGSFDPNGCTAVLVMRYGSGTEVFFNETTYFVMATNEGVVQIEEVQLEETGTGD